MVYDRFKCNIRLLSLNLVFRLLCFKSLELAINKKPTFQNVMIKGHLVVGYIEHGFNAKTSKRLLKFMH